MLFRSKEFFILLRSGKVFYNSILGNKKVFSIIFNQITQNAKVKIGLLENTIESLKSDDKRFAFLKEINVSSDPEITRLIEKYICHKETIGSMIVKPLMNSRSFIYTGDMQGSLTQEKKHDNSGGFFSNWKLGSMINYAIETISIPGTNQPSKSNQIESSIDSVLSSEKQISPESICDMLNKMARKIRLSEPTKLNQWLNQLQLCFGVLFKGCLQFYLEAKDIEKLKNFLLYRFEELKQKYANAIKQKDEFYKNMQNALEEKKIAIDKMKILDTQNFVLNSEKVQYKKSNVLLKSEFDKKYNEEKTKSEEQEKTIRLLIKKIKLMKNKQNDLEKQNWEYIKEFTALNSYFGNIKEKLLSNCY